MNVKINVTEQQDGYGSVGSQLRKLQDGVNLLLRFQQENMSAISEVHNAMLAGFARHESALAAISAGIEGLKQGVTEADKQLLSDLQQRSEALAAQAEQIAAQVSQG